MKLGGPTLRGQLTLVYALALLFGLLLFAGISLFFVDRAEHATLDQRLHTVLNASSAFIEPRNGKLLVDSEERKQFAEIVGINASGAVFSPSGRVLTATEVVVPQQLRTYAIHPRRDAQVIRVNGDSARVLASRIIDGDKWYGTIVIWRTLETIQELDRRTALIFGVTIPLLLLFAMVFGGVVARRGLAPLQDLSTLASEIEAHDLSQRLAVPEEDNEMAALGTSFNRMLDRLQAAFERERRFTGDASHELRGPIAVVHAEAELALRRDRSIDEYRRVLQVILSESEHVEALTAQLLAAARHEEPEEFGRCDLSAVLVNTCDRLSVLAAARDITIDRNVQPSVQVRADETSLTQLLLAIIHNAIKYAPENSSISVALSADRDAARIHVADRGPGFSNIALEHAFERFWRDNAARSRGGAGLGLAIASDILRRLGGTIQLRNASAGGGIVEVQLPVMCLAD